MTTQELKSMEPEKLSLLWNDYCEKNGTTDFIYPNCKGMIDDIFEKPSEAIEALINGGDDCFVMDEGFLVVDVNGKGENFSMYHVPADKIDTVIELNALALCL